MISIVFPIGLNWFYERQAILLKQDLERLSISSLLIPSDQLERFSETNARNLIIFVNLAEILSAANQIGNAALLQKRFKEFKHRVLINHDSLFSPWFARQIEAADGLVSNIFDLTMAPQTLDTHVLGIPYRWIPEALTLAEDERTVTWNKGRPLPWAMISHATPDRASLVASLVQILPAHGFVFCPPLRPFGSKSGLSEKDVMEVLRKTDLYIWGSHHHFPYHECLRALHAIANGAVPAKIDPFFASFFTVPWIYESVSALKARLEHDGLEIMYDEARTFVRNRGHLGKQLAAALSEIDCLDALRED